MNIISEQVCLNFSYRHLQFSFSEIFDFRFNFQLVFSLPGSRCSRRLAVGAKRGVREEQRAPELPDLRGCKRRPPDRNEFPIFYTFPTFYSFQKVRLYNSYISTRPQISECNYHVTESFFARPAAVLRRCVRSTAGSTAALSARSASPAYLGVRNTARRLDAWSWLRTRTLRS